MAKAFRCFVDEFKCVYGIYNWQIVGSINPDAVCVNDVSSASDLEDGKKRSEYRESRDQKVSRQLRGSPADIKEGLPKDAEEKKKPPMDAEETLVPRVLACTKGGENGTELGRSLTDEPIATYRLFETKESRERFAAALDRDSLKGDLPAFWKSVDDLRRLVDDSNEVAPERAAHAGRALVASLVLASLEGPADYRADLAKCGLDIPVPQIVALQEELVSEGGQAPNPVQGLGPGQVDACDSESSVETIEDTAKQPLRSGRPATGGRADAKLMEVERLEADPLRYYVTGRTVTLGPSAADARSDLLIGRAESCDFVVEGDRGWLVSREHCCLLFSKKLDSWCLLDDSTNGTLVTRQRRKGCLDGFLMRLEKDEWREDKWREDAWRAAEKSDLVRLRKEEQLGLVEYGREASDAASIYLRGCGLVLCHGDLICLAPHAKSGFWSLPSDPATRDDSCIDRENLRFALSIT